MALLGVNLLLAGSVCGTGAPDHPPQLLRDLRSPLRLAFHSPVVLETDLRSAMSGEHFVDPGTLQSFDDPRSGAAQTVLWEGRITWNRDWGTRVESRNLVIKADPAAATSVQIWTDTRWIEVVGIQVGGPAMVREYPPLDFGEHVRAVREGRTPHTRVRASASYFDAAEYVRWVAENDPDVTWTIDGDRRVMHSKAAMLTAAVDPPGTVLHALSLGSSSGMHVHMAWFDHASGPLTQGVALPGEERTWQERREATLTAAMLAEVPDRLRVMRPETPSASRDDFGWSSVSQTAADARTGKMHLDERSLAAALAEPVQATYASAPSIASDDPQAREILGTSGHGSGWSVRQWMMALGGLMIAAAVVIWVRRRAA